jgi:outer membrane protein
MFYANMCNDSYRSSQWNRCKTLLIACTFIYQSSHALAADLDAKPVAPDSYIADVSALSPFYLRLGAEGAFSSTGVAATILNVPQYGGNGRIASVATASFETGYFFTPYIAASITTGFPPVTGLTGTGTFAPYKLIAKTRIGLPTFTVHYHVDLGPFRPYLGAGLTYAIIFRNIAVSMAEPNLHSNVGFVLQGGADYSLTDHWGIFIDVRKIWLKQTETGLVAPFPGGPQILPTSARVRSDPILVTAGISYRL